MLASDGRRKEDLKVVRVGRAGGRVRYTNVGGKRDLRLDSNEAGDAAIVDSVSLDVLVEAQR